MDDNNSENEAEQKQKEENLDENYFKQHPQYWKKPQKVVADKTIDSLIKISTLNMKSLINLFSCLDLETLIKLLQVNKTLNKIIKKSETLKKFLEVKEEYVENRGKPNQRLNFGKYSVSTLLKSNCELYSKFGKKYKVGKDDSKIIFGELLKFAFLIVHQK